MTGENIEKSQSQFKLIDRPFVTLCNFELHKQSPVSEINTNLNVHSKYSVENMNINIFLSLLIIAKCDTGGDAYTIKLDVISQFTYSGADPDKELENFSKLNGPAIVYPFMRAALYSLCFASGTQPITLPVINFHKFPVKVEKL